MTTTLTTTLKPPLPTHPPHHHHHHHHPHHHRPHRSNPPLRRLRPFIAPLHEFSSLRNASARAFDRLLLPYPQLPPPGPLVTLAFDYLRLKPSTAAARRLTHLALTDIQGGEAAAYVIRKKLGSSEFGIRDHALDVLCAVMKLCPWFYRFCAGEKFWGELWRGRFCCGDEDLGRDRRRVGRMVEGWVESLRRGAEKDPAGKFWIGKYVKKVLGGGWVTEGGSVNSWVCWVSDSGILAGGHPRLYAPDYRERLVVLEGSVDGDEGVVEEEGESKILGCSRRKVRNGEKKVRIVSRPEIIPVDGKEKIGKGRKEVKGGVAMTGPIRKNRKEKRKENKENGKVKAEEQHRRYEEAIERAQVLDKNDLEDESNVAQSVARPPSPPPSQYGASSVAATARARARERLRKTKEVAALATRRRASDEFRADGQSVAERARMRARDLLRSRSRRSSLESTETTFTEADDLASVGSEGAVTPCTYSFLPVVDARDRLPAHQRQESSFLGASDRRRGVRNTGAFGAIQGGVGPIFRLLTDESYSPEELQSGESGNEE